VRARADHQSPATALLYHGLARAVHASTRRQPGRESITIAAMRASRAKLVTFSAVAAGLVVLGAALLVAVMEKDRILERWYLYRLERADSKLDAEDAVRAIAGLSDVASETAIVKLLDRGDPYPHHHAEALRAFERKVIDRIGETRFLAVVAKYIRDSARDVRTRANLALVPFNHRYHLNLSREITEAKEAAIATCSELLDSGNETASLIAAAFFNDLGESHLDNLSNAARETVKTEKQRAIKLLRARRVTEGLRVYRER
jgi:hypothetical protein